MFRELQYLPILFVGRSGARRGELLVFLYLGNQVLGSQGYERDLLVDTSSLPQNITMLREKTLE